MNKTCVAGSQMRCSMCAGREWNVGSDAQGSGDPKIGRDGLVMQLPECLVAPKSFPGFRALFEVPAPAKASGYPDYPPLPLGVQRNCLTRTSLVPLPRKRLLR
jgi:hypothetical protein